jgi:hypothetical protein
MAWFSEALDRLASRPCCGYTADGPAATEPTALAAMALLAQGYDKPATHALHWLCDIQRSDGSLGIDASNAKPCWPTGWAVLAWQAALTTQGPEPRWAEAAARAVAWILALQGRGQPRSKWFGHDTSLQAWPWVEETQSWVEPTAINLMALKRSGHSGHARSREAVVMLLDRMVPGGGWNYGNTIVLGATLKPHVQPTGLALAALAGEPTAAETVQRSLGCLEHALSPRTTAASLGYALIGAAAHGRRFPASRDWLEAACRRTLRRDASPYKLALLLLAASGQGCPWYCKIGSSEKATP